MEQQSGLTSGQEKEVICHLWSTRETTYQQLRHLQFILQDLKLPDNDLTAGLKVKYTNMRFFLPYISIYKVFVVCNKFPPNLRTHSVYLTTHCNLL